MATLYVRNVPGGVVERLETLAGRAGMSVSAYCARALGEVSRAAVNPEILGALPHHGIAVDDVVHAVDDGRAGRPGDEPPVPPARRKA